MFTQSLPRSTADVGRLGIARCCRATVKKSFRPIASMLVNIGSCMAHRPRLPSTSGPATVGMPHSVCLCLWAGSLVRCLLLSGAPLTLVAAPLNLANAASLDLLSPDEQSLCSILRLLPKPYLTIKEMYIRENERRKGLLKRRDARSVLFFPETTEG